MRPTISVRAAQLRRRNCFWQIVLPVKTFRVVCDQSNLLAHRVKLRWFIGTGVPANSSRSSL